MPELRPQPGPQEDFLSTKADIAIYGGGAGGGKSWGLLMDPIRHLENKDFKGVIFRREIPMITNPGALWDESMNVYRPIGGMPVQSKREWWFPSGMMMKLAGMALESDKYNWQGAAIPYQGFDELTHFTESQFFYMLSRSRSTSGVPGYVRATCNPDPDSWVAKLIEWWIEQDASSPRYGLPIKERAGVLRWFIRMGDAMIWASNKEELVRTYGEAFINENPPMSLTFIPALLSDNKILIQKDKTYAAKLNALSRVERGRLLEGNWKIKAAAGNVFRREWFKVVDAAPVNVKGRIRYWDRAATEVSELNKDPDWTRNVKMSVTRDGAIYLENAGGLRGTPLKVEQAVINTAQQDGKACPIGLEQDPGSAGKSEISNYIRLLAGYPVRAYPATKSKEVRAKPFSAQAEAGNVYLVRGSWNEELISELVDFPDGPHDDYVDVCSGAYNALCESATGAFTQTMSSFTGNIEDRW